LEIGIQDKSILRHFKAYPRYFFKKGSNTLQRFRY